MIFLCFEFRVEVFRVCFGVGSTWTPKVCKIMASLLSWVEGYDWGLGRLSWVFLGLGLEAVGFTLNPKPFLPECVAEGFPF